MTEQNYRNHRKIVPIYHVALFGLLVLTLVGSLVNLYQSIGDHQRVYSASLIVALMIAAMFLFFFCRIFALKAQDRAIRAEENLRHYVLTGKLLDSRLTTLQIVGLRFASDGEFPKLAQKAVQENLSQDAIKKAVTQWRPDLYRV